MKPLYANIKCENKQQLIKSYISIAMLLRGVKVSENETSVLTYFMQHGINSQSRADVVNELKLAKNTSTLKSMMTKLRSKGLIIKEGGKDALIRDLRLPIDTEVVIGIKFYR